MEDRINLSEIKKLIQQYIDYDLTEQNSDLGRCIENINFYDKFPEDLIESRTEWEDLKEMLVQAHWAVVELLNIIEKMAAEKQPVDNKIWCEEYKDYYGNSDPTYGGKLTDLYTLPVGTKFHVANGYWDGEKLEDDYILVHAPTGDRKVKLTEEYHSLYLQ